MRANLIWHIDGAVFQFANENEREKWINAGKQISFEFDPENSDDHAESIMEVAISQNFDLTDENSTIRMVTLDKKVHVTAWIKLGVDLRDGILKDDFREWADENGGWACATIMLNDVDAYISEDSGGEFRWN